jgi:hypothetical protein
MEGQEALLVLPEPVYRNSVLSLRAMGFVLPAPGGEGRVVWEINGSAVSTAEPLSLDLNEYPVSKGDTVRSVAYVDGREISSALVTIMNHPPMIANHEFKWHADEAGTFDLVVDTYDPDGDTVTVQYKWTVNGVPGGTGQRTDLALSQGDEVEVDVIAFDGQDYSEGRFFQFTLQNRQPRFDTGRKYYLVGSTYIYNASASDPDLEPVTFSLDREPPGMTVDPESGQVRWDVPPEFLGTVEYDIVATDPRGLKGVLPMKFSVLKE